MMDGKWKVIACYNEKEDGECESGDEITVMYERVLSDYWDMRNYVTDCAVNGCICGQVYRQLQDGRWEYYMDIC